MGCDERKLSTLRMVNSTIKNADIAARGEGKPPLTDADLLGVFQKMIKQRHGSGRAVRQGQSAELAAQEREEIAIISPICRSRCRKPTSGRHRHGHCRDQRRRDQDMGKVIGALKAKYAGQMDFGKASGM